MGRKICVFIVGLVLIGLAGEVRGQENLDTLWTRRIGGAGNEIFYAMAKANDGKIVVAMYHSGSAELDSGRYVLFFDAEGLLIFTVPIDPSLEFESVSEIRETDSYEIEIGSTRYRYLIGINGTVLTADTFTTDQSYDFDWRWGWRHTEQNTRFHSDTFWVIGSGHETGHIEWWGWTLNGNWLATFDSSLNISDEICFPCNARFIDRERILMWETRRVVNDAEIDISIKDISTFQAEYEQTFSLPQEFRSADAGSRFHALLQSDEALWILSKKRENVSARESFCFFRVGQFEHCITDPQGPAPVAFTFDHLNNVIAFGFSQAAPPHAGLRFDVIGAVSGIINETVIVNSLSVAEPKSFLLLEDNTALVVSTVSNGSTRDLLICRTDTIPTGYYAPQPASIELLIEGPPAWGYRVHSGSYPENQVLFENLCAEARGSVTGQATSRWTPNLAAFNVSFTASDALFANSSDDTLWITAPECESVDVAWNMNNAAGMIKGPFHPEVGVQTFLCRLDSHGVSVRFSIAGLTNMDSIQVWRRNAAGTDSVSMLRTRSFAGHYVVNDYDVPVGQRFTYFLTATDRFNRCWELSGFSQEVFIDPTVVIPEDYNVQPPFPNPFNSQTTFIYELPDNSPVALRIYDITGRQVATLLDEFKEAGTYTLSFDATGLPSGVYVYAFDAWNYSHHGKVLLLK